MMIKKYKKGSEKLLSFWWFLVLAIVGVGIVGGVLMYYSAGIDVREADANILNIQIQDCLLEQGKLINNYFNEDFDIYEECDFNKEGLTSGAHYFNISLVNKKGQRISFEESELNTKERDLKDILNYLKDNAISNGRGVEKKCYCGEDCENYAEYIQEVSSSENIHPFLLTALIIQESSCRKDADSGVSYGLMQITEETFNEVCKDDLEIDFEDFKDGEEVKKNIECGARILNEKYRIYYEGKTFQGDSNRNIEYIGWDAALRGYNGWGVGGNDYYVEEVNSLYSEIESLAGGESSNQNNLESISGNKSIKSVHGGTNYEEECKIKYSEDIEAEKYPECVTSEQEVIFYWDHEKKLGNLIILTASNQKGGKTNEAG